MPKTSVATRHHNVPIAREQHNEMWMTLCCLVITAVVTCAVADQSCESYSGVAGIPPVISIHPQPETYFDPSRRSTFDLKCCANGSKPLQYHWYKDGSELTSASDNVYLISENLVITPQSADAAGDYECRVTNGVQGAVAMSNIAVVKLKKPIVFNTKSSGKYVEETKTKNEGEDLYIECNYHDAGDPKPSYTWSTMICPISKRRDQVVTKGCHTHRRLNTDSRVSILSNGALYFSNLLMNDSSDFGVAERKRRVYKCVALQGSSEEGGSYTIIKVQPFLNKTKLPKCEIEEDKVTALEGSNFSIKCICAGRPTPKITWRKNGNQISNHSSLDIGSVGPEDAGNYECVGKNDAGSDAKSLSLTVEKKPAFLEKPQSHNVSGLDIVPLSCRCDGCPSPGVTWYINDKPLDRVSDGVTISEDGENMVVHMSSFNRSSMTIHCRISNNHGANITGAYLRVQPFSPTILPSTSTITTTSTSTTPLPTSTPKSSTKATSTAAHRPPDVSLQSSQSLTTPESKVLNASSDSHSRNKEPQADETGSNAWHKGLLEVHHWKFNTLVISGTVLVVLIMVLIACCWCWCKYRKHNKKKRSYSVEKMEQWQGLNQLAGVGPGEDAERHMDTESYHSDDSGYDERDGMNKKRSVVSFSLPDLNIQHDLQELYV